MTRNNKPPHIELYDWPNVPERAKELADEWDINDILCVAVVPPDMQKSEAFTEIAYMTDDIDDIDAMYCFIH